MPKKPISKCAPSRIDKYVGMRIRHHRVRQYVTQEKLAAAIGVTFQQLQKYENGTNRISAGRLYDIALTLKISDISTFFPKTPELLEEEPKNSKAIMKLYKELGKMVELNEEETAPKEKKPGRKSAANVKAKGGARPKADLTKAEPF